MIHTLDLQFLEIPHAIAAYLVETSDGPLLIESGPYSTYERLQVEIQRVGFAPQDIKHVLLTHIHFDHAGAAWSFAEQGATIYVHPVGAPHLAEPEKLWQSAKRIYQDDMDRLWGEMRPIPRAQLREVAHKEVLTFGDTTLKAWHTPGHAVHHIAYQLEDAIFTGDVGGVRVSGGLVEPPCPPPDINIEDWRDSIQLLRAQPATKIYLTHFGTVEDLDAHWEALEQQLTDWSAWVLAKMKEGKSVEDTTPQFMEYVADQLRGQGASEAQIKQYEAANPSWMSVTGLMRYWKKKGEANQSDK